MDKSTEKANPLEPPKLHELIVTECPVCAIAGRRGVGLIGKTAREEQLLGHAPQGAVGQMQIIALALDFRNAITFPVAMIATDTCDKCGAVFATRQVVYKMAASQLVNITGVIAPQQKGSSPIRP